MSEKSIRGSLVPLWGPTYRRELLKKLIGLENIIDTAQNMLTLNPYLYQLWRAGKVAIEPVCRLPNRIRVRLRWLRRARHAVGQPFSLDTHPDVELGPATITGGVDIVSQGPPAADHHSVVRKVVIDGEAVDIISEDPSVIPDWDLLSYQYDVLRMAALTGGAEAVEDPDWNPDSMDPDTWYPPQETVAPQASPSAPESSRRGGESLGEVNTREPLGSELPARTET